ncbi:DUF3509 domain-containing protein [Pseudomonas mangiferae]|uniref:DUF3509 domain-containing protein n=1 Tax=Pseudomonas mangiferae TaxID=2593654 RepID=A0A553H1D0_9PSED|nr:DUF3509 domain-containing protein [Pseudomonas mangiferae]TRX75546.1 DUF3509 domain-containing protein [Pseudomonas mangiferae]
MYNPFQLLTEAFQEHYRVNFSLESMDGDIKMTLADDRGVVARRLIKAAQRNDPRRLRRVIDSVRDAIAQSEGHVSPEPLLAISHGGQLTPRAVRQPGRVSGRGVALAVGI